MIWGWDEICFFLFLWALSFEMIKFQPLIRFSSAATRKFSSLQYDVLYRGGIFQLFGNKLTVLYSRTLPNEHSGQANTSLQSVLAKIISCLPDKIGRPSMLCQTFWSPARHFTQLMTSKYWILPEKMSGKVRALCRTSAELCRTCPAYFARTATMNDFGRSQPFSLLNHV